MRNVADSLPFYMGRTNSDIQWNPLLAMKDLTTTDTADNI